MIEKAINNDDDKFVRLVEMWNTIYDGGEYKSKIELHGVDVTLKFKRLTINNLVENYKEINEAFSAKGDRLGLDKILEKICNELKDTKPFSTQDQLKEISKEYLLDTFKEKIKVMVKGKELEFDFNIYFYAIAKVAQYKTLEGTHATAVEKADFVKRYLNWTRNAVMASIYNRYGFMWCTIQEKAFIAIKNYLVDVVKNQKTKLDDFSFLPVKMPKGEDKKYFVATFAPVVRYINNNVFNMKVTVALTSGLPYNTANSVEEVFGLQFECYRHDRAGESPSQEQIDGKILITSHQGYIHMYLNDKENNSRKIGLVKGRTGIFLNDEVDRAIFLGLLKQN